MENRHNPGDECNHPDGRPATGDETPPTADIGTEGEPATAANIEPRLPVPDVGPPVTPRAFALCVDGYDAEDYPAPGDAVDPEIVYAWGLAIGEDTVVYRPASLGGSREYGVFSSAEGARDLFSRVLPLRLIWL